MRSIFYYPDFEVKNENWLKFALLFVDKLRPIVPASGERYLSRNTEYLLDQTDLLDFHRPTYDEGYKASLEALDVVEKLLKRPDMY